MKKIILVFVLIIFVGCNFVKSERDMNINNLEKLAAGKFDNLADFINVFPQNIQDVEFRTNYAIEIAKKDLENFLKIAPEDRNFENTIKTLDDIEAKFSILSGPIHVLEMVSPDENMIKTCHQALLRLQEFAVDAFCNKEIYEAFKNYIQNNKHKEKLNQEEEYFIQESMKSFARNGFDLPEEKFLQVKDLRKQIAKSELEFSQNINLDKSKIIVKKEELAGLSDHFIDNLKKDENGDYILGCDYPTYFEVMENCDIQDTRKKLYFAFANRAYPQNINLLGDIINKRDCLSKELGFSCYADLDLDAEMVQKTETADNFLKNLAQNAKNKYEQEFINFTKNLPENINLDSDNKFYIWDFYYIKNCYKKKNFDIDENKVAEYFPVDNTLNKIFEIYQKFLNLNFKIISDNNLDNNLWHKDVKIIEIYDNNSKLLGVLFLDLYPRENKYSHACMCPIAPGIEYEAKNGQLIEKPAIIAIIVNFPKITKDKPALLKHNDVETFFHEFGHAMHHLLGRTEFDSLAGTNVKRDFIEMPSQMFEEWLWDKDILKMVSCHYQTGQSLSDDLIDRMLKLKVFDFGNFVTRQCWLSLISLNYYKEGQNKDTDKIKEDLYLQYLTHTKPDPDTHFQASFGHLTGYGAKYYSYMWSKVFSLDLFDQIKKEGLLNPEMGQKLIKEVLSKGGSCDPNVLLKNFLGREPKQDAFIRHLV
ncbi:Zn-dependent oligopeptidase [Candidatus Babeliales bacterium]|nr:Zn-dependent oligopeptidase [Candidatus Babeliales bacterium]MCF7899286.1 Zn-dependent oligopeptidase [Candidatus Babeliales bacterium]